MAARSMIPASQAESDTRRWLDVAVIGLNLCPFAKAVLVKRQVHFAVYEADTADGLIDVLLAEAHRLIDMAPSERDTTLLIAPNTLADFLDFNDVAGRAERAMRRAGLEGQLQLATFHPRFEFAGSEPADIANATNRAPYPTLHLLREESIDRAVEAFPQAETIFERNIDTLRKLGEDGWRALRVGPSGDRHE